MALTSSGFCAYCMSGAGSHGLGWMMVGAGGQLLERRIVDRMVYAPERLVFEGAPVLDPPLAQDQASRAPIVTDGPPIDTRAVCRRSAHRGTGQAARAEGRGSASPGT